VSGLVAAKRMRIALASESTAPPPPSLAMPIAAPGRVPHVIRNPTGPRST
jgi:hypothetical protein